MLEVHVFLGMYIARRRCSGALGLGGVDRLALSASSLPPLGLHRSEVVRLLARLHSSALLGRLTSAEVEAKGEFVSLRARLLPIQWKLAFPVQRM